MSKPRKIFLPAILFLCLFQGKIIKAQHISDEVVIRRTNFGVPHIKAKNMLAAGYAMGYLQMEDYGMRVVSGLVKSRGEWAKYNDLSGSTLENQLDTDAANQLLHGSPLFR